MQPCKKESSTLGKGGLVPGSKEYVDEVVSKASKSPYMSKKIFLSNQKVHIKLTKNDLHIGHQFFLTSEFQTLEGDGRQQRRRFRFLDKEAGGGVGCIFWPRKRRRLEKMNFSPSLVITRNRSEGKGREEYFENFRIAAKNFRNRNATFL